MMDRKWFTLIAALLIFPQVVETIYSPALVDIGSAFSVGPSVAAQTLSCYFIAFAGGVMVWGWLCDHMGRRPAMMAGLVVYAVASLCALFATSFGALLATRVVAAFGAAVGSIVTQTMMRDRLNGPDLTRAYSIIGVGLAMSPAIGLLCGSFLVHAFGYRGVFAALFVLALVLIGLGSPILVETRPSGVTRPPLSRTVRRMVRDLQIWLAVLLVAFMNVSVFSYYALAPFLFDHDGSELRWLIWGGIFMTAGSMLGARASTLMQGLNVHARIILGFGVLLDLAGGAMVNHFHDGWPVLPSMMLITMAFAMVISVVLGTTLTHYQDCRGSAGALLGLSYYLLIGGGLALADWYQNLGMTLLSCAASGAVVAWFYARFLRQPAQDDVRTAALAAAADPAMTAICTVRTGRLPCIRRPKS
jgi:MFS family permease